MPLSLVDLLVVTGLCAVKYMLGVGAGLLRLHSFWERWACYSVGGVLGVLFYAYLAAGIGALYRRWRGHKEEAAAPKPPKEWVRKLWQRGGLVGLALITPPLLGPPVGVPLALALQAPRLKVVVWMTISVLLWSLLLALSGEMPALMALRQRLIS